MTSTSTVTLTKPYQDQSSSSSQFPSYIPFSKRLNASTATTASSTAPSRSNSSSSSSSGSSSSSSNSSSSSSGRSNSNQAASTAASTAAASTARVANNSSANSSRGSASDSNSLYSLRFYRLAQSALESLQDILVKYSNWNDSLSQMISDWGLEVYSIDLTRQDAKQKAEACFTKLIREILVNSLNVAPLKEPVLDTERDLVYEMSDVAAATVFLQISPNDGKPVIVKTHDFAIEMLAWVKSVQAEDEKPSHTSSKSNSKASSSSTSSTSSNGTSAVSASAAEAVKASEKTAEQIDDEKQDGSLQEANSESSSSSAVAATSVTFSVMELQEMMLKSMGFYSLVSKAEEIRDLNRRTKQLQQVTALLVAHKKSLEENIDLQVQLAKAKAEEYQRENTSRLNSIQKSHETIKTVLNAKIDDCTMRLIKEEARSEKLETQVDQQDTQIRNLRNTIAQQQNQINGLLNADRGGSSCTIM